MGGVGLIMSRVWKLDLATVFTTHATLLGRQGQNNQQYISLFILVAITFMNVLTPQIPVRGRARLLQQPGQVQLRRRGGKEGILSQVKLFI